MIFLVFSIGFFGQLFFFFFRARKVSPPHVQVARYAYVEDPKAVEDPETDEAMLFVNYPLGEPLSGTPHSVYLRCHLVDDE